VLTIISAGLALAASTASAVPPERTGMSMGPAWISIELPANPFDPAIRGAFLLVHAFHHGTPRAFPVSGVAEGLVNGQRRSVPLALERTSREGVYALRKQWTDDGEWTLVITVTQGPNDAAQAMVQISGGEVIAVRVPTEIRSGMTIPRRITQAEVEASLRNRPTRLSRSSTP
jgi:hypothetical protein